jgi:YidC/Oxa1 family membrane protein insertase
MRFPFSYINFFTVLQAATGSDVTYGPIQTAPLATGGLLGPIIDLVIMIIVTLHNFTGSWGIAIILTAFIVKLLLFKMSMAQYTGMAWMQVLAPMQKQLTERFKGDKELANKKVMELYQELKINPLSGCLPLFIQMPIFFAVFRALYNPHIFGDAHFLGIHLMYAALPAAEVGRYPGMDQVINLNDPGIINFMISSYKVFLYLPAISIVIAYIATSLFYQHQMKVVQKRIPKIDLGVEAEPVKQPFNPNIMTFIVVIFGTFIPAGAMLYFITQNLLAILEYNIIMNTAIADIKKRDLGAMYKNLIKTEPKQSKPKIDDQSSQKTDSLSTEQDGTIALGGESVDSKPKPKRNRIKR